VFREDYYVEQARPTDEAKVDAWVQQLSDVKGKAEVIIGKHRHVQTGTLKLHFDAALTRFSDLALGGQTPPNGRASYYERVAP